MYVGVCVPDGFSPIFPSRSRWATMTVPQPRMSWWSWAWSNNRCSSQKAQWEHPSTCREVHSHKPSLLVWLFYTFSPVCLSLHDHNSDRPRSWLSIASQQQMKLCLSKSHISFTSGWASLAQMGVWEPHGKRSRFMIRKRSKQDSLFMCVNIL